MPVTPQDLKNRFEYRKPPNEEVTLRHESIREACHKVAKAIVVDTPPGREQSLAITKLEEVMFWANAAIARNPKG